MNGSPEHPDTPAASPTPPAAPAPPAAASPATPAAPSPAPSAAPSPAPPAAPSPADSAPAAAASPSAAAPAAPAPAAPVPPGPAASVSAAPPPPLAGAAVPPTTQGVMPRLHRKSPFLAGLLSLLMPGIGQVYVGYYALGFIHVAVFATAIALLAAGPSLGALNAALAVFLGFFVIYNIVDACRRATLYNLALEGVGGIELPDMNVFPTKLQGSVRGGVALIAVGVLLLSNTLFGFSLDWLASWWPLGLVGLGAYLVVKARQEQGAANPRAGEGE